MYEINSVNFIFAVKSPHKVQIDGIFQTISHRQKTEIVCYTSNESVEEYSSKYESVDGDLFVGYLKDNSKTTFAGFLHGCLYEGSIEIFNRLKNAEDLEELKVIANELLHLDGAYSFILESNFGTIVGRDPFGLKPLYISTENNSVFISTEIKPIKLFSENFSNVEPGRIFILDDDITLAKFSFDELKSNDETDSELLATLLDDSVKRKIQRSNKIAISFSGGLDSSIIANLAMKYKKVIGINVRLSGSYDYSNTTNFAKSLGLDIIEVEPTKDQLIDNIKPIQSIIESNKPLDISIALGFFFSASRAKSEGYSDLFVGQFADELFGGYMRYFNTFCNEGSLSYNTMMMNDIKNAYRINFERDEKITSPFVDLHLPYASFNVVGFAINCPSTLKFDCSKEIRKKILRDAGSNLGLPHEILSQQKKAIHFSSGIDKIVKKNLL